MIYLVLAVLSSAAISVFMRLSTDKVKGNVSMLAVNYLTCLVIAGCYTGWRNILPQEAGLRGAVAMGSMQGLLYLLAFILLQINVRKNGVVLSSIFQRLGLLVPMVISVFMFGEMPELIQVIGFCVAVAAIVLINLEKDTSVMQFKTGLILILLCGGCADVMAKFFEELGNPALSAQFLFFTFAVALVLCTVLMLWKRERLGKAELLYGVLVGVPNYFCAKFLLRALESIPAVIVYPTFSVATILVVTLAGVLLFKERLGRRQWMAIGIILVALVLLNI
ncbi:MAG: DMT family transporter [Oscillospiraceae bacterium]|nr:DMT family transporter [Oscillospiraceae bacterium]